MSKSSNTASASSLLASRRTSFVAMAVVGALLVTSMPASAAPWFKSGEVLAESQIESVNWRGRRNGAIVAGAIGLGVLGLAAAAAANQPRGGYHSGYEPGYGYQPSYGYRPRYEQEYVHVPRRQVYGYGYEPQPHAYGYGYPAPAYAPRHDRPRSTSRSIIFDDGRRVVRMRDAAGNN